MSSLGGAQMAYWGETGEKGKTVSTNGWENYLAFKNRRAKLLKLGAVKHRSINSLT